MAITKQATSKTPYEIRLELLQMAQQHLEATFRAQLEFTTKALTLATGAQLKSAEELKNLMPVGYSVEDIIAKAGELYGFVQKKD